jgi:predicted nucleic acid-binding protein
LKHWVIDTWVIVKCLDLSSPEYLDCLGFLLKTLENGIIYIDLEGEIMREYYRYIRAKTIVSKWWEKITRETGRLAFFSNKLDNRYKDRLLCELHFDPDDIKFVGVASKTNDKLLVSGDSDYSREICDYLSQQLNIKVLCPVVAKSLQ